MSCAESETSALRVEVERGSPTTGSRDTRLAFPWSGLSIAVLLTGLLFGWAFWNLASVWRPHSDFSDHCAWVEELAEQGHLLPHPLYHVLCAAAWRLTGTSLTTICYVTVPLLLCIAATALTFRTLLRGTGGWIAGRGIWLGLIAVGLALVSPLNLWSWPRLYLGYLNPTVFHNPTYLALKPFALLLFSLLAMPQPGEASSTAQKWRLIFATTACLLAKPNFVLALLPVLPVFWLWEIRSGRRPAIALHIVGVILPAVIILLWQYSFCYHTATQQSQSSIILYPFGVARCFSDHLLLKLLSSIAFPLVVISIYKQDALHDIPLRLGWLTFASALLMYYLLAERGPRFFHGNFVWGTYACNFILFVASAMFLLNRPDRDSQARNGRDIKPALCWSVGIMHLVCGVVFYVCTLQARSWAEVLFLSS